MYYLKHFKTLVKSAITSCFWSALGNVYNFGIEHSVCKISVYNDISLSTENISVYKTLLSLSTVYDRKRKHLAINSENGYGLKW